MREKEREREREIDRSLSLIPSFNAFPNSLSLSLSLRPYNLCFFAFHSFLSLSFRHFHRIRRSLINQMKIQCDVCNRDEASVFCAPDEAVLCSACDHRVHHANKLAVKHQRFSLLHPSPKSFPLCDICQEKRAFLFCQQDRAILCRDCDVPIHQANEHTQKHNRFLLTGVKLSATSDLYSPPSPAAGVGNGVPNLDPQSTTTAKKSISVQPTIPSPPAAAGAKASAASTAAAASLGDNQLTSSISEYLIEMLPGWRVEDILDSSPASFGFCKTVDEVSPILDGDLESQMGSFSYQENTAIWVPQAPPPSQYPSSNLAFGAQISFKEGSMEAANKKKSTRKWRDDGCFTVPQISPPPAASKRSRTFW
ncbi:B-box zinc finger protein 21 [Diospyros lotus]|uniref:B-box zinc finger protein 21 n=1 Tax=Diospyros lotus TaxID=55363 RepID=UPI002250DDB9|nr:B-box zinc finger protein 21 [Diospyros lotus]